MSPFVQFCVSTVICCILISCLSINSAHSADCSLKAERGPCENFVVKWYFDSENNRCARFWYGNCSGNDNRFDSRELCERGCMNKVVDAGKVYNFQFSFYLCLNDNLMCFSEFNMLLIY